MLIAVNYHYICPVFDQPYPGILGISRAAFAEQLTGRGSVGQLVSGKAAHCSLESLFDDAPSSTWFGGAA